MGSSMASHLLRGGYELAVFNRTPDKARSLIAAGAHWQPTPAAVADCSDVVFTMVGYPEDVRR